jgi:hypothetical protein
MPIALRKSTRKVREHRARLRAQGLRPIQIWVPDAASPAFKKAAREQALLAARSPDTQEAQAFLDSLSDEA